MTEMIVTNGATVLVQIALWSGLAWAGTYMYMSRKLKKIEEYIEAIEEQYGHIMDDWDAHYMDDRLMEYVEYEMRDNGAWYQVNPRRED